MDRCAGCGKELSGTQCCSKAYWSRQAPTLADRRAWYQITGTLLECVHGWYLYGSPTMVLDGSVKWRPDGE